MIDLNQAKAFLNALGGSDFVFQTFTDKKNNDKYDRLAKVLIGTFDEHAGVLQQLSQQGAGVFVQVNEGAKRGNAAINAIRAVWVDLDNPPTTNESLTSIKKYMPAPTIITQSSTSKYHIYWKVTDCPLEVFSRFQQSLAIKFYSDIAVKNLDRVMRLPGFPHQKKDPIAVTCVIPNKSYTLKQIQEAAAKAPNLTPAVAPKAPGTKKDAFGLNIGSDYEVPTVLAPGDRTQKLVAHIGSLTSQGYSSDYIHREIQRMNLELCPANAAPITQAMLEKEIFPSIEKFVDKRTAEERQVTVAEVQQRKNDKAAYTRAVRQTNFEDRNGPVPECPTIVPEPPIVMPELKEGEEDQSLDEWLERFLYIEAQSRVIDTRIAGVDAEYTLGEFKNSKSNVRVGKSAKLSQKWMESPHRQTIRDTIYKPCEEKVIKEKGTKKYNLFTPSDLEPADSVDVTKIAEFKQHLEILFPKVVHRKVFEQWFAMTVQQPGVRIPWCPLLISDQGTGKGFIFQVLSKLLGPHNTQMVLPDRLDSQFNSYMAESTLVCFDEMYFKNNDGMANKLKTYVTEPRLEINKKNRQEQQRDIYCNTLIYTNNDNSMHIENSDRRYWVYRIANVRTPAEFNVLWKWIKNDTNISHLLKWCMDYDLSDFDWAGRPPMTDAKMEMIFAHKSAVEIELQEAIDIRDGPFGADVVAYHIAKDFLELKHGMVINGKSEGALRQLWGRITLRLPHAPHPISSTLNKKRYRVSCIRNFDYWKDQHLDGLRYELARSVQMATNTEKVLPPKLRNIDDAKSKSG